MYHGEGFIARLLGREEKKEKLEQLIPLTKDNWAKNSPATGTEWEELQLTLLPVFYFKLNVSSCLNFLSGFLLIRLPAPHWWTGAALGATERRCLNSIKHR